MSKEQPARNQNPIDAKPFEAFYMGSWRGVDSLIIKDGSLYVQLAYNGSAVEENFNNGSIRLRSRKATSLDCDQNLKPGADVCVLLADPNATTLDDALDSGFLWNDARIVSIKRNVHKRKCTCLFTVVHNNGKLLKSTRKKTVDRAATVVKIDNISILQRIKGECSDNGTYCWSYSWDSTSSSKSKLLNGMFSSAVSWMIVLSSLRGMNFSVKLVQENVVCQIMNSDQMLPSVDVDGERGTFPDADVHMSIISFYLRNELLRPKFDTLVYSPSNEMADNEKFVDIEPDDSSSDSESDVEILYGQRSLRHSKRRKLKPDRFIPTFKPSQEITIKDCFRCTESSIEHHNGSSNPEERRHSGCTHPNEKRHHSDSTHPNEKRHHSGSIHQNEKRPDSGSSHPDQRRQHGDFFNPDIRKLYSQKKLLTPSECKDMLDSCVGNIKSKLQNIQDVIEWPFRSPLQEPEVFSWTSTTNTEPEQQEHEDLWEEMEQSMATIALREEMKDLSSDLRGEEVDSLSGSGEESCQHEDKLDERIGMICHLCKRINEIRYLLPRFLDSDDSTSFRLRGGFLEAGQFSLDSDSFNNATSSTDLALSKVYTNAWNLIPDLKSKLHSHQKKAFEFLWRNLVGPLNPVEANPSSQNTGGCVVSHSPGSGKTLLVISFLTSFLRVFPKRRPLVLAPKIAIYTWCKEFEKWEASIPLYQIHAVQSFRKEMWNWEDGIPTVDNQRPSRKIMHAMDCLMKLKKWHEKSSILLMSYSSFLSLTQGGMKQEHNRFIANVLLNSPGVLVLDEGHNPRSSRSKLRKLLMKVNTDSRILLSGTLFQNNFEEYFNTLCLARPCFINDSLRELHPRTANYLDKRKGSLKLRRMQALARKLFLEEVAQKIESNSEEERKQGFCLLNRLTGSFIDIYENDISDMLPGLHVYTVVLKSTELQREILMKLQRPKKYTRGPLEVELLITVGTIHPCLIKTVACVDSFFNADELSKVEKCKGDFRIGSKAKFVISMAQRATINGERVLIFCHNIAPINFFVELFKKVFGWQLGDEVLVLNGEQELSQRIKVMEKFNGDVKRKCKVLLASTTACAEGISLTAASRVILLDSEWNHSKTTQAIARAFRPGQDKMVYVYRLLSAGTWEEGKYERNKWKAWLSKMLFTGQYVDYPNPRKLENIDDELLRDFVEEDYKLGEEQMSVQMVMKHD